MSESNSDRVWEEIKKRCERCAFYCSEGTFGYCHFEPPPTFIIPKNHDCYDPRMSGLQPVWPTVEPSDWCSHWTPQSWHDEVPQ
jgi:hypothetical protein